MTLLVVDFETYYDRQYSLSKISTEEYIRGAEFEAIGVSVKVNDEPAQWFSGPKRRMREWLNQFPWDDAIGVAHNAMFDMAILNWRFDIRPKRIMDTLAMARPLHGLSVGGSLKALAEHYGLGVKGDEVINALGKRRADFTPEELARYGEYCINDTELTYKLLRKLLVDFPTEELRLIDLTTRMFTEPALELDKPALEKHLQEVRDKKDELLGKAMVSKEKLMSNPKLAEMLRWCGVEPPMKISKTTGKETFAFAKTDEEFKALAEHEHPLVQALVSARLGVKSTLEESRTERFIQIAERGALPIPLLYYGAHTGRWSGADKVNLQNLPRKSPLKKALLAPEGYMVCDCDSSQIEARVLAWLAGQDDLVEIFHKNNAEILAGVNKENMVFDPYKIMASIIYGKPADQINQHPERFVGKTTILGCFGPDTKVLTGNGWKRIVEVQDTDTLWDGEEWVRHEGVIPQGVKQTLTAQGLTATLDHEILTEHGWREWSEVATNRSLFQSAIDRASWKLSDGSNTTNQLAALPGGTPWFGVLADGKAGWTDRISKPGAPLGAMSAPRRLRQQLGKSIGGTRQLSLTSNIANAYSTVLQAVSDVVTTLAPRPIPTTGVGVSSSTDLGVPTAVRSCGISHLSTDGMTRAATSTEWTTVGGMSRVISASLRAVRTRATNEQPAQCKQKLMTYDIAYAGPRNRYTVATDAGPIIVHNCGYGMGAARFQEQLKTFNVHLSLDECEHIISVYRDTYYMIRKLWRDAGDALEAIMNDQYTTLGDGGILKVEGRKGIRLPNGFYIQYPDLRWEQNGETGKMEMVYTAKRGRAKITTRIYGGKVVENVCQALARIIIGQQMLMVARRYRVAMTVHDSVVPLIPEAEVADGQAFVEQCMRTRPKWASKLPLNCESHVGRSYGG